MKQSQVLQRLQPGERIPIRLNQLHRKLILDHAFVSPELEARVRAARVEEGVATISLDLDDLDELIGAVAAEANHCEEKRLQRQWHGLYEQLRAVEEQYTDEDLLPSSTPSPFPAIPRYTPKQGQYLVFIYYHTKIRGLPPSEQEMQAYFKVSAPTVHQMVRALEERGFIERIPKQPRSIRLLIPRDKLPDLE